MSVYSSKDSRIEKLKNLIMEILLNNNNLTFGKRESEYWELHKIGMSNKEISERMGVDVGTCRSLEMRASRKIENFAEKLQGLL